MAGRLIIGAWLWGTKYRREYVDRLRRGVERHLAQPHEFLVFTPPADDAWTRVPGCLARMRAFDLGWQDSQGLGPDDRLVCLDLDLIVTGALDPLFNRPDPFVILQGANAANPCPYNGSVWMLRPGYRPDIWTDLNPESLKASPRYEFHDDQGWLAHKIIAAGGWKAGPESGVYAFQKPGWPKGDALPSSARLVAFPGHRDPSQFLHLPWVRRHWL